MSDFSNDVMGGSCMSGGLGKKRRGSKVNRKTKAKKSVHAGAGGVLSRSWARFRNLFRGKPKSPAKTTKRGGGSRRKSHGKKSRKHRRSRKRHSAVVAQV